MATDGSHHSKGLKPTTQKANAFTNPLENAPVRFSISAIQDAALELYELGLNIFPVPFAEKGGWPWKQFQYIRLHPNLLIPAFEDRCNLATMAGKTSNNLLILDCESEAVFKQQGELLRRTGIAIWSTRSGSTKNGGHYYLRCKEGEVGNIPPGQLNQMELRGSRCYVLTPPSVHPETGTIYQWETRDGDSIPLASYYELDWLPIKLLSTSKRPTTEPRAFAELSTKTRDFIINGAPEGERNKHLFAAACDMAGNNYDYYTSSRLLTPIALACGLPAPEIRDTLKSAFSQPRSPSRQHQTAPKTPQWQLATTWTNSQPWPGRTGQTDRAVLLACCERARLGANEHGVFRASVREVAELARINKKTAATSLNRLASKQLLLTIGQDKTSGAKLWKFGATILRNVYTGTPWLSSSVPITQNSDALERGALGKTASVVWQVLVGQKRSLKPVEVGDYAKLSMHQVYRALKKLSEYNLAQKQGKGWIGIPADDDWLNRNVAAVAGTLGKAEIRKAEHAEERALRASEEILKARSKQRRRPQRSSRARPQSQEPLKPLDGVVYCQNCGQSLFVFEGDLPPQVCRYCADNYGWKRGTIWLSRPPQTPTREDKK